MNDTGTRTVNIISTASLGKSYEYNYVKLGLTRFRLDYTIEGYGDTAELYIPDYIV